MQRFRIGSRLFSGKKHLRSSGPRTGTLQLQAVLEDCGASDLRDRGDSALAHGEVEFGAKDGENPFDARLAERCEAPDVRTADADGTGADGEGFQDIAAAAKTTVDEDG